MRELLTSDDIYTEIIFLKAAGARTVVLVEGDRDIRVLEPHLALDRGVECIQGHGKSNCLSVMSIVDSNGDSGVLAIVDRDWSGKIDQEIASSNVVLTDYYDIDATVAFASNCLERVASNFSAPVKLRKHLQAGQIDVESLVVRLCVPLGKLRYLSARRSLELSLSDFPIHVAVRSPGYEIDVERMIDIAMRRTPGCILVPDVLVSLYQSEQYDEDDKFYCSGHDIHRLMAHLVRKRWGGSGGEENIANAIRASLSDEELEKTRLYLEVVRWSSRTDCPVWRQAS